MTQRKKKKNVVQNDKVNKDCSALVYVLIMIQKPTKQCKGQSVNEEVNQNLEGQWKPYKWDST